MPIEDLPPLTSCTPCTRYDSQVKAYIQDLNKNEATKSKAADVQRAYEEFQKSQASDYKACQDASAKLPPEYRHR